MKKFKSILILIFISSVMYAGESSTNKAINNLKKIAKEYNANLSKKEELDNINLDEMLLKDSLAIMSGKPASVQNIATEFNYYKSSIYQIFSKPNFTTTLKLNKDEKVIYVGGGDTESWQIDETVGGNDGSTYLFVKPLSAGIKTNLNIITDKRAYLISLESTNKNYNPYVQWKYPFENNMSYINNVKSSINNEEVKITNANDIVFNYKYDKKSKLAPDNIFSDGLKTVLIMNTKLQEAPVVYIYGEDNQLSLVNYRMIGNKIIIDKVVNKLQLVLGNEKLEIKR